MQSILWYVLEGLLLGDIEYEENSDGSFVVLLADGFELFLASSIPDLKLHVLGVHFNLLG